MPLRRILRRPRWKRTVPQGHHTRKSKHRKHKHRKHKHRKHKHRKHKRRKQHRSSDQHREQHQHRAGQHHRRRTKRNRRHPNRKHTGPRQHGRTIPKPGLCLYERRLQRSSPSLRSFPLVDRFYAPPSHHRLTPRSRHSKRRCRLFEKPRLFRQTRGQGTVAPCGAWGRAPQNPKYVTPLLL